MATSTKDAIDRLWEITRHLSQGEAGGPGSIFAVEKSQAGDRLMITLNESAGVGRRFSFSVASSRKVSIDNVVPAEENVESHQQAHTVGVEQGEDGESADGV